MHHITIRDQVCNVMASLTKTFLSVPRLSCKTLKRSLLADHRSCCMPFSMVGSTGTVLQNDESAPCKRAVPARSKSGSPPRSCSDGSSGSYVVGSHPGGTVSSPPRWGTLPGQGSPMDLLVHVQSSYTPCSPFSSHICDDLGDRRDVLLQEIASYLLLQNELVNYQFETTRSRPKKINWPSQRGSLWRSNRK